MSYIGSHQPPILLKYEQPATFSYQRFNNIFLLDNLLQVSHTCNSFIPKFIWTLSPYSRNTV